MTEQRVGCPHCKNEAEWVENKAVYGRNYGKSYMIWLCRPCGAYVGCHQNTKRPKGSLATAETRLARKKAHAAFDPVWQSGRYGHLTRKDAYNLLKDHFGEQVHIGESDVPRCEEIIKFTNGLTKIVPVYATKPEAE